jgi:sphinganine-1-phosphate aldolase
VDTFIADLKDAVDEVRTSKPGEDGTMVAVYGLGQSSAVGPSLVGELAASFIDAMYKA